MKKFKNTFFAWVALLGAGFALVACSDNTLDVIEETPQQQEQAYFFSVKASKGGDVVTKALTEEDDANGHKQLVATWATTENVYVKHGDDWATGSLNPDQNGAEATLKGSLSGTGFNAGDIAEGNTLTLQFPKSGEITYAGQKGTLDDISANFDYAVATATVTAVDGANVTTTSADFVNQQAIVKFELYNHKLKGTSDPKTPENDSPISATDLTIVVSDFYSAGADLTLDVVPDAALNVFYVAIPGFADKAISLTATGTGTYSYAPASNVSFVNGTYYKIKVYPSLPTATTTTAPALVVEDLVYNGGGQALVTAGSSDEGTVNYSVSTTASPAPTIGDGSWTTEVPAQTNAGTYYVWYYVEGDSDHYDSAVTALGSKAIAQKPVTFSGLVAKNREYQNNGTDGEADVTSEGFVYTGVTFDGIIDGDGLSVTATGAFAALTIGQHNVTGTVTLTGADAANYVLSNKSFTVQAYIIPFLNLDASTHRGYYVCTDLSYYLYNAVPAGKTVRGVIAYISSSGDGINGEIANPVEPGHGLIIDKTNAVTTATTYNNAVTQLATYNDNDANKFNGQLFKTANTSFEYVENWRIPTDSECDTDNMAIYGSNGYSILENNNGVNELSTNDQFWTSSTYQQYHIYFHYSTSSHTFKHKNYEGANSHSTNVNAKVRAVVSF